MIVGQPLGERGAQIDLIIIGNSGEQTGEQPSVSSQPQAIAKAAEVRTEWADKPDRPRRPVKPMVAGRAVSGYAGRFQRPQRLFYLVLRLARRDE